MISKFTFNAISQAAITLKSKKIRLGVVSQSPLAMLMEVSPTQFCGLNITDEEFYVQLPPAFNRDIITQSSDSNNLLLDNGEQLEFLPIAEHEQRMTAIKEMGRKRLSDLMNFTRNVMQPCVKVADETFDVPSFDGVTSKWSVVPIMVPELVSESVVGALFAECENPTGVEPTFDPKHRIDVPDDLKVPELGNANYDDTIKRGLEAIGKSPSDLMVDLISNGLGNVHDTSESWSKASLRLVQWLLVHYYIDNPWKDCGVSKDVWKEEMSNARFGLTSWVATYLEQFEGDLNSERLVHHVNGEKNEIYVYYDIFKMFQDEHGGSSEAVIGSLYLPDGVLSDYTLTAMVGAREHAEAAWASKVQVEETRLRTEWEQDVRQRMCKSLSDAILTLDDESMPLGVSKEDAILTAFNRVDEITKYTNELDVTGVFIEVLGDVVFKDTDAPFILSTIHNLMKGGMEAKQAATQAGIQYVTAWTFGAVTAIKV